MGVDGCVSMVEWEEFLALSWQRAILSLQVMTRNNS